MLVAAWRTRSRSACGSCSSPARCCTCSWELALVSLVRRAAVLAGRAPLLAAHQAGVAREAPARSGSISAVAEESLGNAALVQAYNRQEHEVGRFHEREPGRASPRRWRRRACAALFSPLIDLIELAGALIVIGLGTWELSQGRLTLGGLLAFLTYLTPALQPDPRAVAADEHDLLRLGRRRARDRAARRAPGRRRSPSARCRSAARAAPSPSTTSRTATRRRRRTRCASVAFAVAPGETLALVGASGAGKSTVGEAAAALLRPERGRACRSTASTCASCRCATLRDNVAVAAPGDARLPRHGAREHRLRAARRDRRRDRRRRRARPTRTSSSRELPEGYDTRDRPARPAALRRPAPADRDRARDGARRAGAAARRADDRPRRRIERARARARCAG